jgi:riboflavin kinase/FMN adenylyltransferase
MEIRTKLEKSGLPTAVALGFFDGVHIGHRLVVEAATFTTNLVPTVFTFKSNPKKDLLEGYVAGNLTNAKQKASLFSDLGIKLLYTVPFESVQYLHAKEFVKNVLVEVLQAKKVFCGSNYRFGKGGMSGVNDLEFLCDQQKIEVKIIPMISMQGEIVSSTKIRKLLLSGKVKFANNLLKRPYSYTSKVFEIYNTSSRFFVIYQYFPKDLIIPKFGVYSSLVTFKHVKIRGVTKLSGPDDESQGPLSKTILLDEISEDPLESFIEIALLDFLELTDGK